MVLSSVLKNVNKDLPTIFFIRHGDKLKARSLEEDAFCPLSKKGLLNSRRLGILLKKEMGHITSILSSPIQRCIETGQILAEGNNTKLSLEKDFILRCAYIDSPEEALDTFRQYQLPDIVRKQLKGESLKGFSSIEEGTQRLLSMILQRFKKEKQLDICITHDLLLTTFFFALTQINEQHIEKEWFGYLDGFCLQQPSDGNLRMYRDACTFDIDVSTGSKSAR